MDEGQDNAPGFISGLFDGLLSSIAPQSYAYNKRREVSQLEAAARQAQLDALSDTADQFYQPLYEAATPKERVGLQAEWTLAKSRNGLLAELMPEMLGKQLQYQHKTTEPTALIKEANMAGELDPTTYGAPQARANLIAQHLVKPQTQINMNQGRPTPASGYMYTGNDANDPTQTYIPGGPADPDSKPLTESESKSKGFHMIATEANKKLTDLFRNPNVSSKALAGKKMVENIPLIGGVAGMAANTLLTDEEQQSDTAKRAFVNSILRRDSGATILPSEFDNYDRTYFEQHGDTEGVKKFKASLRETAIKSLEIGSGDVAKNYSKSHSPHVPKIHVSRTGTPKQRAEKAIQAGRVVKAIRSGTDKATGRRVYMYEDNTIGFTPTKGI